MKGKRKLADYAQAGRGRIGGRQKLTFSEILELMNLARTTEVFDAISMAFFAGAEAGYRSAVKGGKAK